MTTFEERYRQFKDLSVTGLEYKLPATLGNCTGSVERHRLIVDATCAAPAHDNPCATRRTSHARAGNALFHSIIIRRATLHSPSGFDFIRRQRSRRRHLVIGFPYPLVRFTAVDEFSMSSRSRDRAVLHHENSIRPQDRRRTMGDHDKGARLAK
jgi:hypothetical protein